MTYQKLFKRPDPRLDEIRRRQKMLDKHPAVLEREGERYVESQRISIDDFIVKNDGGWDVSCFCNEDGDYVRLGLIEEAIAKAYIAGLVDGSEK